jgi:indole-3-acetaldehyde oxidase
MGKEAAAAAETSSTVVLAVNGKRYEAAGVAPSTSLLEFLRTQTPVRGPKLGCGEGTLRQIRSEQCHCIVELLSLL